MSDLDNNMGQYMEEANTSIDKANESVQDLIDANKTRAEKFLEANNYSKIDWETFK